MRFSTRKLTGRLCPVKLAINATDLPRDATEYRTPLSHLRTRDGPPERVFSTIQYAISRTGVGQFPCRPIIVLRSLCALISRCDVYMHIYT